MEDRYREYVIRIIKFMDVILDELGQGITNLAMSGEYSDFSASRAEGEAMKFNLEDFENIDDINVKICLELYDKINDTMESLININAVTEEEIDNFDIGFFDAKCRMEAYEREEKRKNGDVCLGDFWDLPDDVPF